MKLFRCWVSPYTALQNDHQLRSLWTWGNKFIAQFNIYKVCRFKWLVLWQYINEITGKPAQKSFSVWVEDIQRSAIWFLRAILSPSWWMIFSQIPLKGEFGLGIYLLLRPAVFLPAGKAVCLLRQKHLCLQILKDQVPLLLPVYFLLSSSLSPYGIYIKTGVCFVVEIENKPRVFFRQILLLQPNLLLLFVLLQLLVLTLYWFLLCKRTLFDGKYPVLSGKVYHPYMWIQICRSGHHSGCSHISASICSFFIPVAYAVEIVRSICIQQLQEQEGSCVRKKI